MSKDNYNANTLEADLDLLQMLSETRSCSGNESRIRNFIKMEIEKYCDEIKTDSMGNLYGIKFGKNKENSILLCSHMDEIGFMVRLIDKNGFIRVAQVGGQNIRLLPGSRIIINGNNGDVPGIFGEKAIHLMESSERDKLSKLNDLFIDIGANNKEEAENLVSIGDFAEFDQKLQQFKDSTKINGKSLDDRCGCYISIRALQKLSKLEQLENTIIFCFSVQEEIGVRGATVASFSMNPTSALVLEVAHGIDFPSANKNHFYDIELSKGPIISVGPNIHPKISKKIINIAKEKNIEFQIRPEPSSTRNDARIIQLSREGIPVGVICVPLRYMHTIIETIDLVDLEKTVNLVTEYLIEMENNEFNL